MDDLAWLRLQIEWGADEALAADPIDRRLPVPSAPAPRNPALQPAPVTRLAPSPANRSPAATAALAQSLADQAQTPAALRAALLQFDGCALRTTATNLVFSDGAGTSGLVVIADVPGAAEDRAGLPFAGAAAVLLDQMLGSAGIDRAAGLSTSLLPWRPPGGRAPTDAETQACLPFLLRHLALARPRYALLVGSLTARILLPEAGRRLSGTLHAMTVAGLPQSLPTVALPSLAHIQVTPSAKRGAWADLLRLRRAIQR